jgi:hypothetical protein
VGGASRDPHRADERLAELPVNGDLVDTGGTMKLEEGRCY